MQRKMNPGGAQKIARGLPPIKFEGTLTNSMRSTFLNCRKEFEWSYLRRLSTRRPNTPFLVGGLFHDGLELMYKRKKFWKVNERRRIQKAVDKACMTPGLSSADSDKLYWQSAVVYGMLSGYARHYLERDLKVYKIVALESEFVYKLDNGWKAKGKRDAIFKHIRKKLRILVEHKTTARLDAGYILKLPLDNQILGYCLACEKENGWLPDEVLYNVALKPSIRQKQTESFDQFLRRVEDLYISDPTKYFYREKITVSEKAVRRFEKELQQMAREMERAIEENFFYQNTSQCTRYGRCAFMPLCVDGPTAENLSRYRVRKNMHEELEDPDLREGT